MAANSKQTESERAWRAPGMRRGRTRKVEDWAVRHVNDVIADGADVNAKMPVLSAYLGHVSPAGTYWY